MNTNPKALRVLCYGDSNTWGQRSDQAGRYPSDVRWTGRLQQRLGEAYEIIEEGLSGRTTDVEYRLKPGRNGKTFLSPCLASHHPLDVVVLMLGTNDLKMEFHRSPKEIANAVSDLIEMIREFALSNASKAPAILLVSPAAINPAAKDFTTLYRETYSVESSVNSQALASALQEVAEATHCAFFDASQVASTGDDGLHLHEEGHRNLGDALAEKIRAL